MVRIRLTRVGLRQQAAYRIIVTDKRNARDSRYIEVIGHYNPRTRPATEVVDEARALYWLSVGAQPSEAVAKIFNRTGTAERYERMKAGEELEALVAEAEENRAELPDQRTEYPAPAAGESKIKAREALRKQAEAALAGDSDDDAESE
jgi:small subunit ribosomal protein S16